MALKLLYDEFYATMTMVGVNHVKDIGRHHLAWVNADGSLRRLESEPKSTFERVRGLAKL